MSKAICEVSCWSFLLDDAPQSGRLVEVDSNQSQTLRTVSTMQEKANMLNEVVGENEKCVFYFMEKPKWAFGAS